MDWDAIIGGQQSQPYFQQILDYVAQRRAAGVTVYPPAEQVFNAFELTPFAQVKVVILGQDPYHGPGQAHGLSFSVAAGVKIPPSLNNIYKELAQDIAGFTPPEHGNLSHWAKQGVLLLNAVLTVEQGEAHAHRNIGWQRFTDAVVSALSTHRSGLIFLLWGSQAQKQARLIDQQKHRIFCAPHPSPLSAHRGFFGCRHFSQVNTVLRQQHQQPIDWQL